MTCRHSEQPSFILTLKGYSSIWVTITAVVRNICFSDDACLSRGSGYATMLSPVQCYLEEMGFEAFSMGENTFPILWFLIETMEDLYQSLLHHKQIPLPL